MCQHIFDAHWVNCIFPPSGICDNIWRDTWRLKTYFADMCDLRIADMCDRTK